MNKKPMKPHGLSKKKGGSPKHTMPGKPVADGKTKKQSPSF